MLCRFTLFAAAILSSIAHCSDRPLAEPNTLSSGTTNWTMLNVTPAAWQADCHLLELADGRKLLIDPAEASDAPPVLLPYLRQHNVGHLTLVIISHFHRDHYGRLKNLVEAGVKIDRVAINLPAVRELADREKPWGMDWDEVQELLRFLSNKGIPCFTPKAGDILAESATEDGVSSRLEVLCLFDGINTPIGRTWVNDTSMVLRFSHGSTRVLFTGDLDRPLGAWLATSEIDLRADILKAPHHGGEGHPPNEFYDRVAPQIVMVSTSKDLWSSVRCARMRAYVTEHEVPHLVTGIDGTVSVKFTDEGFVVSSERRQADMTFRSQAR